MDTDLYRICNEDEDCKNNLNGQDPFLLRNVLPLIANPSFNDCTKILYKNEDWINSRGGIFISDLFDEMIEKKKPDYMIPFLYHTYVCPDAKYYLRTKFFQNLSLLVHLPQHQRHKFLLLANTMTLFLPI